MTISGFIECSTCTNTIKTRYQVGYITPFKVRIGCKECGKIIKGTIDLKEETFDFEKDQYDSSYSDADQTMSISSELPISIISNKNGSLETPFMALGKVFGFDSIMKFQAELKSFQPMYDKDFEYYTMVNELLQNNSIDYLLEEVKKRFRHNLSLELDEFYEYSLVINNITHDFFKDFYTNYYDKSFHRKMFNHLFSPNKAKTNKLKKLRDKINEYTNLTSEYKKGQILITQFLSNIKSFLPVIFLSYNNDFQTKYGSDFVITTFDFQELKEMYVEQFEYLARLSSLHFGLYNLAQNGEFNDFGPIPDCSDLESYQNRTNGSKKEVVKKADDLNDYFLNTLNSQIRNGLGHFKTTYDPVTQEIKYFPYRDKSKLDRSKSIYLIDFAYLIYQQILKVKDTQILIQKLSENLFKNK